MSAMTEHPDQHLSAYLDDALAPDERAPVHAHLDGCDRCRDRLADLRATSRLLAALPPPVASRPLRPRVQRGWLWLRPVRLLGSFGTGTFLFLFLASYVLNSGSQLGGGTTESERLAAQGKFGPAASALAAENAQRAAPPPPARAAAATAPTAPAADGAYSVAATASPGPQAAAATGATTGMAPSVGELDRRTYGPPSTVFLALALLCSIAAFAAHRRLRRT